MLTCIIPAYNEEGRVGKVIKQALKSRFIDEVIVVDDGSADSTAQEVEKFRNVLLMRNRRNTGKSASVRKAAGKAKNRKVILLDADISITTEMIDRFIEKCHSYDMAVYRRETDEQAIQRLWRALILSQLLYSGVRIVDRKHLLLAGKGKYLIENELNKVTRGTRRCVFVGPYFFHYEKYKKLPKHIALFQQAKMIAEIVHRIGLPEIIRQMIEFRVLLRHAITFRD